MEFEKSPGEEEKSDSPSQDFINLQQPLKRDVESLEDFEDLSKDISSVKDVTAQFLQRELDSRQQFDTIKSPESFGDVFNAGVLQENESRGEIFGDIPQVRNDNDDESANSFVEFLSHGKPENYSNFSSNSNDRSANLMGLDDSSNNFINFEQTEFEKTKVENDSLEPFIENQSMGPESVMEDLNEAESSAASANNDTSKEFGEFSFMPKKGESSPIFYSEESKDSPKKLSPELRSGGSSDSPTLMKHFSEPGLGREHDSNIQQIFYHVKDTNDGDHSDEDDVAPEPIPKDYPEIGVLEGKHLWTALGLDTWFCPALLNPKVESLVYWRDPRKSGVVFGTVMIVLLSLTTFSLISVVAYTSLIVLAAAVGFRIYKNVLGAVQKTSDGHPFKPYLLAVLNHRTVTAVFMSIKEYLDVDLTVNPDKAREIADVVVSHVNWAITKSRSLFLVEDLIDSIKFGVLLWCMTYVGSWFNGLSLLIIAFVGLFTLPKVYENNKTQIDANLNIVRSKINEITEKIKAVSPIGKKAEETKGKSD